MDPVSNYILENDVVLVGQSPNDPNKRVIFDVDRDATGNFHIHERGSWHRGKWEKEYSSGGEAIEALRNYIEVTYPSFNFDLDFGEVVAVAAERSTNEAPKTSNALTTRETEPKIENGTRAGTNNAHNNLPENLQKNSTNDSPSQSNINRAAADEPETEYAGGSLLEDVERWIPSLFESAHKGVSGLKNELENDVNESNWFGRAIVASALDIMDTAMSFTEGIPLGLLDTRRIGEGFAEGTWEGAKKDISRALNVLPHGKLLKAVDRALTGSDVIENLNQGNLKGAGLAVGMGVLAVASKGKGRTGKTKPVKADQVLTKEQIMVTAHLQQTIFSQERHFAIGGMVAQMEGIFSKQTKAAVSVALHLRSRNELQMKFGSRVKVSAGPGDIGIPIGRVGKGGNLISKQTIDLEVQTKSAGSITTMKLELKATAWINHNGGIGMPAMNIPKARKSKIQQIKAIENSAIRNQSEPHLIVTPKDVLHFDPKQKQWNTLTK